MIYVGGVPFSSSSPGKDMLDELLEHPILVSSANSFRDIPERAVSEDFGSERSGHSKCVYVFQREYATVDPALVDLIGTDEATTCVGIVIRNRQSRMTSVAHMDFPRVVDIGITQMLSLVDNNSDAELDVHLIGSFEEASPQHADYNTTSDSSKESEGYSLSLCTKIVETLQKSWQKFHMQTLFVLRHNTRWGSDGNPHPIFKGLLVNTSTGSVFPATFDRTSRCPDEIVRRVRVGASHEDHSWDGKLLETYDTQTDRFIIACCSWTLFQLRVAKAFQNLSDSEILLRGSTSPSDEGPDFVENGRRKWDYIIKHPDWRETFPRKKPHIFERTSAGWRDSHYLSISLVSPNSSFVFSSVPFLSSFCNSLRKPGPEGHHCVIVSSSLPSL